MTKKNTLAKKPKAKTPPPSPTSPATAIQDTARSNTTPSPSPLSVAAASPVEVATIAAHLSRPYIPARDCVIRAYELLEWATFASNALLQNSSDDFSSSGIGDWLSLQVNPTTAMDSQAVFQRVATNAGNAVTVAGMDAEKREQSAEKKAAQRRRNTFVLEHLLTENEKPLPIDLKTAMREIFRGYKNKPQKFLLEEFLVATRNLSAAKANQLIEKWSMEGMPWLVFEEALYGYSDFRNNLTSTNRSESGKAGGSKPKKKRRKKRGAKLPGEKNQKKSS